MAVIGVIAEYNPFHRGHGHQLKMVREQLGADTAIVACMSGNVVQRGDFPIIDKFSRAEAALLGGVDLVLELPAPWASATAERFAGGGVSLLAATGVVTHLAFGCECGDLQPLEQIAAVLCSDAYEEEIRSGLKKGDTFAAARQTAVENLCGDGASLLREPNNNLAVEYLKAILQSGVAMTPVAIRREGAAHDSGDEEEMSSASLIRRRILHGGEWKQLLPDFTAKIIAREIREGRGPVTLKNTERSVLAVLRRMNEEDFAPCDGGGEGLYHRFYSAVHSAAGLDELLETAKTKRYSMARIRRMVLHSYLGICPADAGTRLPYLRVLGANGRGRKILREMHGKASLPILTKPGDVGQLGPEAEALMALESRCTDLYTLAWQDLAQAHPGREYRISPRMLS